MTDAETTNQPEKEVKYATFSGRMLASVIDTLLTAMFVVPFFGLLYQYSTLSKPNVSPLQVSQMTNQELIGLMIEASPSFLMENIIIAIIILVLWVYKSATPGKMLLKMKIADARTFAEPKKWQYIVRYFGYTVSFLPLGLGFIWIYFDKRGQGFHDKMARTVVIKYK